MNSIDLGTTFYQLANRYLNTNDSVDLQTTIKATIENSDNPTHQATELLTTAVLIYIHQMSNVIGPDKIHQLVTQALAASQIESAFQEDK